MEFFAGLLIQIFYSIIRRKKKSINYNKSGDLIFQIKTDEDTLWLTKNPPSNNRNISSIKNMIKNN